LGGQAFFVPAAGTFLAALVPACRLGAYASILWWLR
jgi:hypothetical protein